MSKTAIAILAVTCVAAGAGGTYLALRGPVTSAEQVEAAPDAAVTPPVAESEEVLESAPAPPTAIQPATPPARQTPPPAPPKPARTTPAQAPRIAERTAPPSPSEPVDQRPPAPIEPPAIVDNQASRSVEPPAPVYEELVISADSVIGLQLDSPVSSDKAQVEDDVVARITRDVRVGDRVAIPAGAKALGEVTLVERGGKVRERARLGVRFTSVVLADGTRLPIRSEAIYREGDAPGRESAAKIGGGAIGGAIIGGILGGAKGAAIGGSIGVGAGTAAVVAGDRNHATLSAGTPLTVRLEEPVTVTVER